jgi:hypothetical protein
VSADVDCPSSDESGWPEFVKFTKEDLECRKIPIPSSSKDSGEFVDLNGDGVCEYFDDVGHGSGGIEYVIRMEANKEIVDIGYIQLWSIVPRAKVNGWYSLYYQDENGGTQYTFLYTHTETGYRVTKEEEIECERM